MKTDSAFWSPFFQWRVLIPNHARMVSSEVAFLQFAGAAISLLPMNSSKVAAAAEEPTAIRAFQFHASQETQEVLDDRKKRIAANVTLYWLTNTVGSSARLYWENKLTFFDVKNVKVPITVSDFPDELYQAPRSWAERTFPKLIYYNKLNKCGHFAA